MPGHPDGVVSHDALASRSSRDLLASQRLLVHWEWLAATHSTKNLSSKDLLPKNPSLKNLLAIYALARVLWVGPSFITCERAALNLPISS